MKDIAEDNTLKVKNKNEEERELQIVSTKARKFQEEKTENSK